MAIIVYTDTHIGAPHATEHSIDDILDDYEQRNQNDLVIATGDIFDIKNSKRSEVESMKRCRDKLKNIMGNHYMYGNHELADGRPYFGIENNVMWLHYHVPAYCGTIDVACDDVKKWESGKKAGRVWTSRFLMRIRNLKPSWHRNPPDKILDMLANFAFERGCHTVVFGHTHTAYDQERDGIRLINPGRGRQVYDI